VSDCVLIPGAWMGAWVWEPVARGRAAARRLEAEGIKELVTFQFYAEPGSTQAGWSTSVASTTTTTATTTSRALPTASARASTNNASPSRGRAPGRVHRR